MTKIKALLVLLATAAAIGSFETAKANGPLTISGRWAGPAFANAQFDLDGDGVAGREFNVRAFDQIPLSSIEGALDTSLISVSRCAGPGSLELRPAGAIIFRGRFGDSLYAQPDPTAPNLCFDPANPSETAHLVIVGGTGPFAGATGTGTLVLHDTVLLTRPVSLPGFGVVPAPTLIDSRGEFTLRIQ